MVTESDAEGVAEGLRTPERVCVRESDSVAEGEGREGVGGEGVGESVQLAVGVSVPGDGLVRERVKVWLRDRVPVTEGGEGVGVSVGGEAVGDVKEADREALAVSVGSPEAVGVPVGVWERDSEPLEGVMVEAVQLRPEAVALGE